MQHAVPGIITRGVLVPTQGAVCLAQVALLVSTTSDAQEPTGEHVLLAPRVILVFTVLAALGPVQGAV